MPDDYKIRLTDLAAAKGGPELENAVRAEIARLLASPLYGDVEGAPGLKSIDNLILHCFEYQEQEYICTPKDGVLVVDTVYYEEQESKLEDGPFKGFKLCLPAPESGDE